MRVANIDFDNVLLDKKSYQTYESIIRYLELDVKIRYLVLFGPGWNDAIYDRIRCLINEKRY